MAVYSSGSNSLTYFEEKYGGGSGSSSGYESPYGSAYGGGPPPSVLDGSAFIPVYTEADRGESSREATDTYLYLSVYLLQTAAVQARRSRNSLASVRAASAYDIGYSSSKKVRT